MWLFLVPLLSILASGCATTIGARSLPTVRANYNEAVARSSSEQMLLNLVRLRYAHGVQFLEPVSVVTTYSFTRGGSLGGAANLNGESSFSPITSGTLSGSISATETPTITYSPLAGEAFVRQLAAPLPPALLLLLIQGGWPVDLVLPVTVSRLGRTQAPAIAAATEGSDFLRIVSLLAQLQRAGDLEVDVGDERGPRIGLRPAAPGAAELLERLGEPDREVITLTGHTLDREPGDVPFLTRSMLDTLFYLSHGVQVPAGDRTARDLGVPLPVVSPRLHVRSGEQRPEGAYVAVPYGDRWFWIADDDLASKRVFGMLTVLFSVMSAPAEAATPVLTLPR